MILLKKYKKIMNIKEYKIKIKFMKITFHKL